MKFGSTNYEDTYLEFNKRGRGPDRKKRKSRRRKLATIGGVIGGSAAVVGAGVYFTKKVGGADVVGGQGLTNSQRVVAGNPTGTTQVKAPSNGFTHAVEAVVSDSKDFEQVFVPGGKKTAGQQIIDSAGNLAKKGVDATGNALKAKGQRDRKAFASGFNEGINAPAKSRPRVVSAAQKSARLVAKIKSKNSNRKRKKGFFLGGS